METLELSLDYHRIHAHIYNNIFSRGMSCFVSVLSLKALSNF